MTQLYKKYCPKKWSGVIGQEVAVKAIQESLKQGWGGRPWWIVGESGTGCTIIARLLAGEQADESRFRIVMGIEVDCPMVHRMASENPGKEVKIAYRAYIIDRPSDIPEDAMVLLLTVLPCLHKNICVIFTQTTGDEQNFCSQSVFAQEMIGLCQKIELAKKGLEEPFAKRCKEIAELEGLGGKTLSAYKALARKCRCNMRAMLNYVETGEMMKERP